MTSSLFLVFFLTVVDPSGSGSSSLMESFMVQKVTDGAMPSFSFNVLDVVGSFSTIHSSCLINLGLHFPLASTSWAAGYSPMNFVDFQNITSCVQRNMMLLGDGLEVFTFNRGMCNLLSELLTQFCFLYSKFREVTNKHTPRCSLFPLNKLNVRPLIPIYIKQFEI